MVEFGEQLKKTREAKGMTQQTLAEKLFVSRQTISHWECGDRFPDLITTKKLADILETTVDNLLGDTEMKTVVEKSNVITNPISKKVVLLFYFFLAFGFTILALDTLYRFTGTNTVFLLLGYAYDYTPHGGIAGNMSFMLSISSVKFIFALIMYYTRMIIMIAAFVWAIKGNLIPKCIGRIYFILMTFNIVSAVIDYAQIIEYTNELIRVNTLFVIHSVIYIMLLISTYLFFCTNKHMKIYSSAIFILCVLRLPNVYVMYWYILADIIRTRNIPITLVVFCVMEEIFYASLICQTAILRRKRKIANIEETSLS